jgi:hypothetical protein
MGCARRDRWAEEDLAQVRGFPVFFFSYFLFQFEISKLISNPGFEFQIFNI